MSWTVDQSGNAVADGGEVKHGGAVSSEKKGNAIWMDDKVGEGVHCWSFDISGDSGIWLGVGTEDKFGPGYQLAGLLYGGPGNLSDGGALITGHWGPSFGQGDKIGMRLEVAGEQTTLAFSKNGSGLGVAYDIRGWAGGPLRPVVSLSSPGQGVRISSAQDWGLQAMSSVPETQPGIAGSWQLDGEDTWELGIEDSGAGLWRVSATVANCMSCSVTESGGVFSVGPVMTTQMLPPPYLQAGETSVTRLLAGVTNIARERDTLVVTAGDRVETFSVAGGSTPATKEKIRWMNN